MKYTELKASIEAGAQPVYLFEGTEAYFRRKGEEQVKNAFLQFAELNYAAYEGDVFTGAKLSNLTALLSEYPFMSNKRIISVSEFYPSEKDFEAHLKKYFDDPSPESILVIVNSKKPEKGKADFKRKKNVAYVDCSPADEDMICRWIFGTCKKSGIAVSGDACTMIFAYCLGNMARVSVEVEKLIVYAKDKKRITAEDVEALVYKDAEYKIYEMTNALARKNYGAFVEIMSDLKQKGFDSVGILASLCSYFKTLSAVNALKDYPIAEVARILGAKEYAVKKNREQIAILGGELVGALYTEIFGLSCKIRSGEYTSEGALELAIAKIFYKSV